MTTKSSQFGIRRLIFPLCLCLLTYGALTACTTTVPKPQEPASFKQKKTFELMEITNSFSGFQPQAVVGGSFGGPAPGLAVALWGNLRGEQAGRFEDGSLGILLQSGRGSTEFFRGEEYDSGISPVSIASGDFNGDRFLDVATVNVNTLNPSKVRVRGDLRIYLGNGDGTFNHKWSPIPSLRRFPAGIGVEDFDRDGSDDIVIGYNSRGSGVSVFFFNEDGGREALQLDTTGRFSLSIATGDFNGDRLPDFAVAHAGSTEEPGTSGITVFLGKGTRQFTQEYINPRELKPLAVTAGDFNNDQVLDLAVLSKPDQLVILTGNGEGRFRESNRITLMGVGGFNFQGIQSTDFDKDGQTDLVFIENKGSTNFSRITILFGTGKGEFRIPLHVTDIYEGPEMRFLNPAVVDVNSDGYPDIVAPADSFKFLIAFGVDWEKALTRIDATGKIFIFLNRMKEDSSSVKRFRKL